MDDESFTKRLLGLALAAVAARAAMLAVELLWTRGLGKDLPGEGEEGSLMEKVVWVGLAAAGVAMAREVAEGMAKRAGSRRS